MKKKCCFVKCKDDAVRIVTFDCGPNPDQVLALCDAHHNSNPAFLRYVKKIEELSE